MKSKLDSLTEPVEDQKPTIACQVETYLEKEEEEVAIPGYETIYRYYKQQTVRELQQQSKTT